LLKHILAHIEFLEASLEQLQQDIEERLRPFEDTMQLLMSIPGIATLAAAAILAEIGTDMSRFPSAAHLARLRWSVSRQQTKWGQAAQRQNHQRQGHAAGYSRRGGLGDFPHQRQLSLGSVPSLSLAHWEEECGDGCSS
jgi:hypothetical protein